MGKYVIRDGTPEDRDEFLSLCSIVFGEKKAAEKDAIFDWILADNPARISQNPDLQILDLDGVMAAAYMCVPTRLKIGEEIVFSQWLSTAMSHPDHRGFGVRLIRALFVDLPRLGFPIENTLTLYKRSGGKVVVTTALLTYLFNAGPLLKAKVPVMKPLAGLVGLAWWAFLFVRQILLSPPADRSLTFVDETVLDGRFDAFWNEASQKHRNLSVRDSAYVNWRYLSCPIRNYEVFTARKDGEIVGFAALRVAEIEGVIYGYLVDILDRNGDSRVLTGIVKESIRRLKVKGADISKCLVVNNNDSIGGLLSACGFLFRAPFLKMMAFSNDEGFMTRACDTPDDWFLTLGDSDLDL